MNKYSILSGTLSVAVISSLAMFPTLTDAKGNTPLEEEWKNAKTHRIHQMLENDRPSASEMKLLSTTSTGQDATSATYSGSIQSGETHVYRFVVRSTGTLQVNTDLAEHQYQVYNTSRREFVSPGETILSGEHELIIFGETEQPQNYNLTLSGFTFVGEPNTTLPQLSVTKPSEVYSRLAKGEKSLDVEGSVSESTSAEVTVNLGQHQPLYNEQFKRVVYVQSGYNDLNFVAENANLNRNYEYRNVLSPSIERMAGADRYETSAQISKRLPVLSDTVVIATGTNFPDALSGGALATWEGAPILLTKSTGLSNAVQLEVSLRKAKRAILLGGPGVISDAVIKDLQEAGVTKIERQAGADRYDTSAKIAQALLNAQDQEFGEHSDVAFIATGTNYPDALAASSPSGSAGAPILLVKGTSLPASIKQVIENKGIKHFYIVGGPDVVSTDIERQLKSYGGTVKRLAGTDRYKTALKVAQEFVYPDNGTPIGMNPSVFHVAYGGNYPDALAQGPLAGYMSAPLLLTKTGDLDPEVSAYLQDLQPDAFYISGGVAVVSSAVENKLNSYIRP